MGEFTKYMPFDRWCPRTIIKKDPQSEKKYSSPKAKLTINFDLGSFLWSLWGTIDQMINIWRTVPLILGRKGTENGNTDLMKVGE